MKLPKRGQKGFTLIELLIVVAILGVLAAVVIPNIAGFIGAGEEEAQETELSNIQAAVTTMMVANEMATLPAGTFIATAGTAVNQMDGFPAPNATIAGGFKVTDPGGDAYTTVGDKDGFILYGHDETGDNDQVDLENYVTTVETAYWYYVDVRGTVSQELTAPP